MVSLCLRVHLEAAYTSTNAPDLSGTFTAACFSCPSGGGQLVYERRRVSARS